MIGLSYTKDRSSAQEICSHLLACDGTFSPPLSTRTSIADYSAKLAAHAARCEAWEGTRLVGLVAVYCNAPDKETAFVTSVSIDPAFQRQGIARHLLGQAIDDAYKLGFRQLSLEVDKCARDALTLYAGLGFASAEETGMTITMSRKLEGR